MLVGSLARWRRLFGSLRSDVLMVSANVGGKLEDDYADRRRLVGPLETCDWSERPGKLRRGRRV